MYSNAFQVRWLGLIAATYPPTAEEVAGWRFHNTLASRVYVRAPFPVVSTICRSPQGRPKTTARVARPATAVLDARVLRGWG